jgi:hypothetical protein
MVFVFFISLLAQNITLDLTHGKIGTLSLITKMTALRSFEKVICLLKLQLVTFVLPFKVMASVFVEFEVAVSPGTDV